MSGSDGRAKSSWTFTKRKRARENGNGMWNKTKKKSENAKKTKTKKSKWIFIHTHVKCEMYVKLTFMRWMNNGWKMRNSFFINHTFRMLFHVLNIFDYIHIEHYIMKQFSTEKRTKWQMDGGKCVKGWQSDKKKERRRDPMMKQIFFIVSFSSFMELLLCHFTNSDWE